MMKTSAGSFLSCTFTSQANPISHTLMISLPAGEARLNKQLPLMSSALINLVPSSEVKFATPSVQLAVRRPRQTFVSAVAGE
jgi:hypothetical protein